MSESNGKSKFYLPNLREALVKHGKTFSDFTDCSALIDKSPSRRVWADGTSAKKGVTETMANRMSIRVCDVFKRWDLDALNAQDLSKVS